MASFAGCNVVQPLESGCFKIAIIITNIEIDPDSGDISFDGSYKADSITYENGYEEIIETITGAAQGLGMSADSNGGGGGED